MIGVLHSRAVLVGLLVVGVLLPALAPSVLSRFADLADERTLTGSAGNSLVWRLDYWQEILPYAADDVVTGIGLKMIEVRSPTNFPAHNDLLRVAIEGGALGLTAYVGFGYGLYRLSRSALRRAWSLRDRGLAVALAACLAAFVTASTSGNLFGQAVVSWYLFAIAALALGVHRSGREPTVTHSAPREAAAA